MKKLLVLLADYLHSTHRCHYVLWKLYRKDVVKAHAISDAHNEPLIFHAMVTNDFSKLIEPKIPTYARILFAIDNFINNSLRAIGQVLINYLYK